MNVLVIAPHPDDEILGCGGIIAKRVNEGHNVTICIVTEGKSPMYSKDFVLSEENEIANAHTRIGVKNTILLKFPSALLDTVPQHEINDKLSEVVDLVKPDEVFIPHFGDIHRDHQIVAEASMVALRPNKKHIIKKILAYEVLSETDWNIHNSANSFNPNVYEDISDFFNSKSEAFMMYQSQVREYPSARSIKGIQGLALHRGAVAGVGLAEAFMLMREILL